MNKSILKRNRLRTKLRNIKSKSRHRGKKRVNRKFYGLFGSNGGDTIAPDMDCTTGCNHESAWCYKEKSLTVPEVKKCRELFTKEYNTSNDIKFDPQIKFSENLRNSTDPFLKKCFSYCKNGSNDCAGKNRCSGKNGTK